VSGAILGAMAVVVIAAGGWLFCLVTCLVVYQCTTEYYGFVTSPGIAGRSGSGSGGTGSGGSSGSGEGLTPPVAGAATLSSALCIALVVWTHVDARVTAALAVASTAVLSVQLLGPTRPRFSQLTSSVFGLFYCGYLPSFWIKLRHLSAPLISSPLAGRWPVLLGGLSEWTVGLAATFTTVLCIIAADTGAYFFGRSLGRTPLSAISPKKTVEGAAGGAACAAVAALAARSCFGWPASPLVALGLGALTFASSVFGDLLESVMKRDAGLKDAGDLIPGHGGLLDRLDSYMFTGAVVYFAIRFVLPVFGV
jgi:phosphatidate cytidylyltransferase